MPPYHLVGLVVKACALGIADLGLSLASPGISYRSSHTSGLTSGTPVATTPGA